MQREKGEEVGQKNEIEIVEGGGVDLRPENEKGETEVSYNNQLFVSVNTRVH